MRWSTAHAYLRPAMERPNLDVAVHAHVDQVTKIKTNKQWNETATFHLPGFSGRLPTRKSTHFLFLPFLLNKICINQIHPWMLILGGLLYDANNWILSLPVTLHNTLKVIMSMLYWGWILFVGVAIYLTSQCWMLQYSNVLAKLCNDKTSVQYSLDFIFHPCECSTKAVATFYHNLGSVHQVPTTVGDQRLHGDQVP